MADAIRPTSEMASKHKRRSEKSNIVKIHGAWIDLSTGLPVGAKKAKPPQS